MTTSSFVPIYMQSNGVSSVHVGTVTAINSLLGIFAPPLWGIIADKLRSSQKTYITGLLCATVFIALVPVAGSVHIAGVLLLTILIPIIHFFRYPTDSILNGWIIQTAQRESGIEYGSVRLWGSVGQAIMATAYYFVIRIFSMKIVYIVPLFIIGPIVFLARKLPDSHVSAKTPNREKLQLGRLFQNYYYVTYLLFSLMISFTNSTIFIYRSYLIIEVGGNPSMVGLIIGLKILFEVPTMMASRKLISRLGPTAVLCMVGAIFLSEHFLYTICSTTFQIVLIQMYQGLGNGLNTPTFVNYIQQMAPSGLKATAQSVNAMAMSTGGILAGLLGGRAVAAIGVRALFSITCLSNLVAVFVFILSFVIGQKLLKKEPPVPLFKHKMENAA